MKTLPSKSSRLGFLSKSKYSEKSHHWATKVQGMSVNLNEALIHEVGMHCTRNEFSIFQMTCYLHLSFPPLLMKKKKNITTLGYFLYSLIRSHWDCWLLIDEINPDFPWEALFYSGSLSPRDWGGGEGGCREGPPIRGWQNWPQTLISLQCSPFYK